MELKKKFLIKKVFSILCLIVVVLLFFCGWLKVRSSYYKEKFHAEIEEWEAKIDIDDDIIEEMEEELEMMQKQTGRHNADFSVKKFVKNAEKILDAAEDLALSPMEMAGMTIPAYRLKGLVDNGQALLGGNVRNVREKLEMITVFGILSTVIMTLTIVTVGVYIIKRLRNEEGKGLPILILQILCTLLMAIFLYVFFGGDALGVPILLMGPFGILMRIINICWDGEMCLTIVPLIALALVIVSNILWKGAMKDYGVLKNQNPAGMNQNVYCQQTVMNNGIAYGQYSPNASHAQYTYNPVYGQGNPNISNVSGISNMPQQPRCRFCTNCGHEIMPGALFCQRCGSPVAKK